jgi:hypothetical protein
MSAQDVRFLIENAEIVKPLQRFNLKPLAEINFSGGEEWLVRGLLPKHGVVLGYGASQSFKTFALLDLAICISTGISSWGDFEIDCPENAACVYIAAEGMGGIEKRISAIKMRREIEAAPFFLLNDRPALGKENDPDKLTLISEIKGLLGNSVSLVIIDTLSQCLGGGEENGAGMQAIIAAATDIAKSLNCVVVLVHHTGHQGKDPRGHSSALGNPDSLLLFENDGHLKSKVTVKKQKDGETGFSFGVELSEVALGTDKYGKSVTTLAVETIANSEPNRPQSKTLNSGQRFFMAQFEIALGNSQREIKPFPDGPKLVAVSKEAVREQFNAASAHKEDAAKRQAFNRALNSLVEASYLITREINGHAYLWKRRTDEASTSKNQNRDTVTPLKGGVTPVTQGPATRRDNVTSCHDVTPSERGIHPTTRSNNSPALEITYIGDGSVEL